MDHSGVGHYVTRQDGSIAYLNRALAQMLGYDSVQAFYDAEPHAYDFYVDPAAYDAFRERAGRDGVVRGMLFQLRRTDGELIWVSEHGAVMLDASGAVHGYCGSMTNVSELIEMRDRLQETETSYRILFDRAVDGIYRTSLDGRVLKANPAMIRMCGMDPDTIRSPTAPAQQWYVDPSRRSDFLAQLLRDGQVMDFVSEVYNFKTWQRFWASESAYLVRDRDGAALYIEGTVRDISGQRKVEQDLRSAMRQAQSADRAKSRFLAHMSHELRTPLNAILGFSDLLVTIPDLPRDKIAEYANDIHISGQHLLDLINDVLDLSRVESDTMEIRPEAIDAGEAVAAALTTIRALAAEKHLAVAVTTHTDEPVHADRRVLHQCLLNLLSNAVKYTPADGQIAVEISPSRLPAGAPGIAIAIIDDGPGIPADRLARLGQPFVTGSDSYAGTEGTGLGLAITSALATRLNGCLDMKSAVGAGTRMTLLLPRAE